MIRIALVAVDGKLVGRTASDRWNLLVLFSKHVIYADRNQAGLKAARRRLAKLGMGDDFRLVQCRGVEQDIVERPSRDEFRALDEALPLVVERHHIPVIV
jgi:hypothetical protein